MNITTTLVAVSCYSCGVEYGIPKMLDDAALEKRGPSGRQIWCPNGHQWHYVGETDADRERRLRRQAEERATALTARLDQTEASLRTTKGVVTKMRKRAIVGACQFCHRHFVNVERHVATKHAGESA